MAIPAAILPMLHLPAVQGAPFLAVAPALEAHVGSDMTIRAVYRLDLYPAELRWRGMFRSGAIPAQ